jgi:hypothetical protein
MRNLLDIINEMSEEGSMELEDSFDFELNEETLIESGIVGFTDDGIIVECDETALRLLESNGLQLEEVEVDESGLQAYLGKKKYGEKGMKALQQAGREGASKEKMAQIRAKHDKLDEKITMDEDRKLHSILRKSGIAIKNNLDAQKRYEQGQRIFAFHDQDMEPVEVKSIKMLNNYAPDQLLALPAEMDEAKYQGREVPLGKPMAGDVKKSKVYVKGPKGNVVKVNFGDKKMRIKKSNPGRRKNFRARHNCDNPGPRWKARYWSCRAW